MTKRTDKTPRLRGLSRRHFMAGAGGAVLTAGLPMPAVLAQAKEFDGVTLNGAAFQHGFMVAIKEILPEFKTLTGITVNLDLQAFPVYNQRMDLELSTEGSSYDFCNITYPFSGRWVGSGWLSSLDDLIHDANATPADFDPSDFISGAQNSVRRQRWHNLRLCLAARRPDACRRPCRPHRKGRDEDAQDARRSDGHLDASKILALGNGI